MEQNNLQHSSTEKSCLTCYQPLFVLILVSIFGACTINYRFGDGLMMWMHSFMGLALLNFSMLKLFDIQGFSEGFAMYDLIAARNKIYGKIYPFIEFGLGILFLGAILPTFTYLLTIVIGTISLAGVIISLRKGMDTTKCVCMGTALNVPLSTVTLVEDAGMIVMAFAMLMGSY